MKKYALTVGIDVSKNKLDVTLLHDIQQKQHEHFVVSNDEKGIKSLFKVLKKQQITPSDCLFCFENTGVYSMPLCFYLDELKLNYAVVAALEIKRSKGMVRGKSDKTDSRDIALYAFTHRHKLQLSQLPEKDLLQLKVLFTEREKLLKAIKALETTKENEGFLPKTILKTVLGVNQAAVKALKTALKKTEVAMEQIIANNSVLAKQEELACSVPGVGPQTARYLLIVTRAFTAFDNWRKLACYAGIAPFENSSGSSVRGRTKVHHLADKKMKSLLNMCALNSKRYDMDLQQYYQRKTEQGKHPMLVMNALRCKVLSRVFATVKRETPYVNVKKFAA